MDVVPYENEIKQIHTCHRFIYMQLYVAFCFVYLKKKKKKIIIQMFEYEVKETVIHFGGPMKMFEAI